MSKLSIKEVKEKHQCDWLRLPHVVSVGLSLDEAGEQVICLGLNCTLSALNTSIAGGTEYPKQAGGYKVILTELGQPKAI